MTNKEAPPSFDKAIKQRMNQIAHHTVPESAWFWLILLILLVIGILIWSIIGSVEINIQGRGIVLSKGGLFTIQTPVKGIAASLYVKPGDIVQKGSVVAEIYDAQKEMLLKTNQIKVDNLKREVNYLRHEVEVEAEASTRSLKTQLASLQFDIKILNERLQFLEKEYKKKLNLYQEGLIILNLVQVAERQISQTKISIEEKKGEIADIQFKLKQSYRTEELKAKELELLKAEEDIRVTEASLRQNKIYSEFNGKILELLINPGEVVAEGQPIYNVELLSSDKAIFFYGFFPSEFGKYIRKGSIMEMALSTVNEKEYGSILSRVKEVSQYAISEKAILNEIHNADLARFLSNQQPVTQVIAEPISDSSDPSKYAWTSKRGPSIELSTGIVGTVEVTSESIHPIFYLIPLKEFKKNSYGDSL